MPTLPRRVAINVDNGSGTRTYDTDSEVPNINSTYKKLTENEIKNYRKSIEKYRWVREFRRVFTFDAIEQKNLQLKIQKFKSEWKNEKVFFFENLIYLHRQLFETFASGFLGPRITLPSRAVLLSYISTLFDEKIAISVHTYTVKVRRKFKIINQDYWWSEGTSKDI